MKYAFRIWCEWDIGQEYAVYATEEAARRSLKDDLNIQEILRNDGCTLEDLFNEGIVSIGQVAFVE
jgi:hypothetical protein